MELCVGLFISILMSGAHANETLCSKTSVELEIDIEWSCWIGLFYLFSDALCDFERILFLSVMI